MNGFAADTLVNVMRNGVLDTGVWISNVDGQSDIAMFGNETDHDFNPGIVIATPVPQGTKLLRLKPAFGPEIILGPDTIVRAVSGDKPASALVVGDRIRLGEISPYNIGQTSVEITEIEAQSAADAVIYAFVPETSGQQYALHCGVLFL